MAFNLARAAGALASVFHARAITANIRAQLIAVPAAGLLRPPAAHPPAPRLALEQAGQRLFDTAGHAPPATT
jgi:hypothetical protein